MVELNRLCIPVLRPSLSIRQIIYSYLYLNTSHLKSEKKIIQVDSSSAPFEVLQPFL